MTRFGPLVVAALLIAGCGTPVASILAAPSPTDSDAGPLDTGVLEINTDPASVPFTVITSYRPVPAGSTVTGVRIEAGSSVVDEQMLPAGAYEVRINERPCGVAEVRAGATTTITIAPTETGCTIRR
ncbi:MAG TPA: hypothetical protein VGK16_06210 [Candidatus Limnocylindrales bacterium]|jgi:hypothetical protein